MNLSNDNLIILGEALRGLKYTSSLLNSHERTRYFCDMENDIGTLLFQDPDNYYPPTPPPTSQIYVMLSGQIITLHLVGHSPLEGHLLWNGGRAVSKYLETHCLEVAGKTVLELGAGSGLPSLVSAILGARKVVVTDFPDADLIDNLWRNIGECNRLAGDNSGRNEATIIAEGFVWGGNAEPLLSNIRPDSGFDLIILADLLFRHSEHRKLVTTIEATMKRDSGSKALVFFTSYRPWLQSKDLTFFDVAKERGFITKQVLEKKMDEAMFPNDPGDEDIRKTIKGYVLQWAT